MTTWSATDAERRLYADFAPHDLHSVGFGLRDKVIHCLRARNAIRNDLRLRRVAH